MPAPDLDPVELAIQLMSIDSTTGREGPAVDWMQALLAGRGWRTTRIPVTAGRDDLLAWMGEGVPVTLQTHLDTAPPFIAPRLDGRLLRGRGACDAKGIAAAMVCAGERLRRRGVPIALLLVVGEESSHDGARAANAAAVPSRVLLGGEPTESTLAVGTKGAMRLEVLVSGRAAHSAYPHLGCSAIDGLVDLLHDLRRLELPADPVLGATTVNVGSVAGGIADNVVAPSARARLLVRLAAPASEVRPLLERWAAGRADLAWGPTVPPARLGKLPGFPTSVVAFATDVPELSRWGTPYLFGPGSIRVAHSDDEHVAVAELRAAVDTYERLAIAALEAHPDGG